MNTQTGSAPRHHHSGLKSFFAGVVVTSLVALGATAYNTNAKFHSSTDQMMAKASSAISDAAANIKDRATPNETK